MVSNHYEGMPHPEERIFGTETHAASARPLFDLPMSDGKPAKGAAGCQGDSRKEVQRQGGPYVRLPRSERSDVRV
jgi:hypothetical protein